MRLSSLMHKMFPDKWNGLSIICLISLFFFNALYSTSCYIILCHNTTTVCFIKESSFFLCFIDTLDRHSLLSFHSLYLCFTYYTRVNTDRLMNECSPYIFLKALICCVHSLARKLNLFRQWGNRSVFTCRRVMKW